MKIRAFLFLISLISATLPAQENHTADQFRDIYTLISEGQIAQALVTLDTLITADSTNAALFYLLGRTYSQVGDNTNALKAYHHTVELDSTHINAMAAAAALYEQAGYYDRAVYYFEQALAQDFSRFDLWHQLGELHYGHDYFKKAHEAFSYLTLRVPQNASYLMQLGKCEEKLNNPGGAINCFKKAHTLDSTNVACLYTIGRLYYKIEQPDSAQMFVEKGLALNDKHALLHLLKANIRYDSQDYAGAIDEFYKYQESVPDSNAVVMKKLGFAWLKLENYQKALGEFNNAVMKNKDDAVAVFYIGVCLKHLGNAEWAARMIARAIELSLPVSLHLYYAELGECYHELKDYEAAIKAFRRALFYQPEQNDYVYALANIYYDYYQDRTVALKCYEDVAANNDNEEVVNYAKMKVKELREEIFLNGN